MKFLKLSLFVFLFIISSSALATESNLQTKFNQVLKDNDSQLIYGPNQVSLADQATMQLEKGEVFIPVNVLKILFDNLGTPLNKNIVGIVIPGLPGDEVPKDDWGSVILTFEPIGFVKDDDAKNWNFGNLLSLLRKSQDEANQKNVKLGIPERELLGWIKEPKYDSVKHQLIWATETRVKGKPEDLNSDYKTEALGREGVLGFSFGTKTSEAALHKDIAESLLSRIEYKNGKRYIDFLKGTDKVAEFGLAALIVGVAAKKLGLFALIAAALVKWGKLIAVTVAGIYIALRSRKKL